MLILYYLTNCLYGIKLYHPNSCKIIITPSAPPWRSARPTLAWQRWCIWEVPFKDPHLSRLNFKVLLFAVFKGKMYQYDIMLTIPVIILQNISKSFIKHNIFRMTCQKSEIKSLLSSPPVGSRLLISDL